MDNFKLIAEPFLGGYSQDFNGTRLHEVTDISLMSIAQPLNGRAALERAIKKMWGCPVPAPGQSTLSKDGATRLLCLGTDAFMALLSDKTPVAQTAAQLGNVGYHTDQSDNWVALRLTGPRAVTALERICPIDLHKDVFAPGAFARTSMEHLGAIVLREAAETFFLLSSSSSAVSFLHACTTSIDNVS